MNQMQQIIIQSTMTRMSNAELIEAEREITEMLIAEKATRGIND